METVLIILVVLSPFVFALIASGIGNKIDAYNASKPKPVEEKKIELSEVSKFLLKQYSSLPPEHQAEPITPVLQELDRKYSMDNTSMHFQGNFGFGSEYKYHIYSMACKCASIARGDHLIETDNGYKIKMGAASHSSTGCTTFPEYQNIYNEIVKLKKEIDKRERALLASSVDETVVLGWTERLRAEREVVEETTKMLTGN